MNFEQVCVVVKDVDYAVSLLKGIGMQDWFVDEANTPVWAYYDGRLVTYTFKMAFFEFPGFQLELLQVLSGDTRHNNLLSNREFAFSHFGFHVDNLMWELKEYLNKGAELEQFAVTDKHCYAYVKYAGLPIKIIQRLYK